MEDSATLNEKLKTIILIIKAHKLTLKGESLKMALMVNIDPDYDP